MLFGKYQPFFKPIYIPGTKLKIYGPITFEEDTLEKIIIHGDVFPGAPIAIHSSEFKTVGTLFLSTKIDAYRPC